MARTGTVYLVGAGPGDPDLLTLRAARLIERAALVVHDGLVDPTVLALAPAGAELVSVAKSRARHTGYKARQVSAIQRSLMPPSARSASFSRRIIRGRRGARGDGPTR